MAITMDPVLDEAGNVNRAVHIACDISEHKRADEALRESEAKFKTVAEELPEMIFINRGGRVVYANSRCEEVMGYTKNEFLSPDFDFRTLIAPEFLETVEANFRSHMEGKEILPYEYALVTKEGNRIETIISTRLIDYGGDRALLGIVTDITERKMTEERLKQRDAELVHLGRLAAMGELAAGLAHELNQPLYAITNYTTGIAWRLRDGVDEPGELNDTMEKVVAQARRAADIIDRLRRAVKKRELNMGPTNLNDLLQGLLKLLAHEIHQNSVTVRLDLEQDLPPALADDIQIQQVAVNLIRNAVDAMRDVPSDQRCLTLTTSVAGADTVEVAVGDTGKGLSDEALGELFDPFFTTKAEGLGMGLSISRTIIQAHKGRIWATSNSPQGTVFRFVVPTVEGGLNRAN